MASDGLRPGLIVKGPLLPEPVEIIAVIPLGDALKLVGKGSKGEDRFYWHVSIFKQDNTLIVHRKKGYERVDLTPYLLSAADAS